MRKTRYILGLVLGVLLGVSCFIPYQQAGAIATAPFAYGFSEVRVAQGAEWAESNPTTIGFGGEQWQVIGYNDGINAGVGVNSDSADTMTVLLAKGSSSKSTIFNSVEVGNDYENSTLQNVMQTGENSIYNSFPAKEKSLIVSRDLNNPNVTGQYVWPLDYDEAYTIPSIIRQFDDSWWLRQAGKVSNPYPQAMDVSPGGSLSQSGVWVHVPLLARPAFTFDISSVGFTMSQNVKASLLIGDLTEASEFGASDVVKMSVFDSNLPAPTGSLNKTNASVGEEIVVSFDGATPGSGNYISCILEDVQGNAVYYAKLADVSNAASGTANLVLPSDMYAGDYKLKLFCEQQTAANHLDYMSEFAADMNLSVTSVPTVKSTNPSSGSTGISVQTASVSITFNQAMNTLVPGTVTLSSSAGDAVLENPQWSNSGQTITYEVQRGTLTAYVTYTFEISGFESSKNVLMNPNPDFAHSFTTGIGVSGKVLERSNSNTRPLEGATVVLTSDSSISTTTNSKGEYTLEGIPSGTGHTVTVSKQGYETTISAAFDVAGTNVTGVDVVLNKIETFEVAPFVYGVTQDSIPSVQVMGLVEGYTGGTVSGEVSSPVDGQSYRVVQVSLPDTPELEYLECVNAEYLRYINISRNVNIADLTVSNCVGLTTLYCPNSSVVNISLENCPVLSETGGLFGSGFWFESCEMLESLTIIDTAIRALELETIPGQAAAYPSLKKVTASGNNLLTVNVSETSVEELVVFDSPTLAYLQCENTQVSELSAPNCPNLVLVLCNSAQLSSLDLSDSPYLGMLNCSNNHLLDIQLDPNVGLWMFDGSGQTVREFMTSDRAQGYMSNRLIEFGSSHVFDINDAEISYGSAEKRIHSPKLGSFDFTADIPVSGGMQVLSGEIELYSTSYDVVFRDWDGSVLSTQTIGHGGAALAPADPTRENYTFTGWDTSYDYIVADTQITALYVSNTTPVDTGKGVIATTADTSPWMFWLAIFAGSALTLAIGGIVHQKRER